MYFSTEILPAQTDSYMFLVTDKDTGVAMIVDPCDGEAAMRALKKRDLFLDLILNTHYGRNSTSGNELLQKEFGAPVIGPKQGKAVIPGISRSVEHGEIISFSSLRGEVLSVKDRPMGHVSFHFPKLKTLFCGEALSSLGCGRLFEDSPVEVWEAMKTLRSLPNETQVYSSRERGEQNAKFALAIDKNNEAAQKRASEIATARKAGQPSVPFRLGTEKDANPFLRADQPDLCKALVKDGLAGADADTAAIFGTLCNVRDRLEDHRG